MREQSGASDRTALQARWAREVRARLAPLALEATRETDIVDELVQHIEEHYRELIAAGTSPDDAERVALAAFRTSTALTDRLARLRKPLAPAPPVPGVSASSAFANLSQDLRYAMRALLRQPGFTAAAVLSLALGIGVNTAMFTVIYGVLLRGLPYPAADRLVRIVQTQAGGEVTMGEYEFVRENAQSLAAVSAYRGVGDVRVGAAEQQNWAPAVAVSLDFLRTLGIPPQLGREFTVEEAAPGGPPVAMIGDAVWRNVFGADPQILGRPVLLNGEPTTIVGILPRHFWFHQPIDVAVPLRNTGGLGDRGTNTQVIARLRAGVSLPQAQADVFAMTERIRQLAGADLPRSYRGLTLIHFQDWLVGDVRVNLLLLFAATGVLLLIACGNVALLLLTRFAARVRELAVRIAIGSSRGRIFAHFLTEHVLLAVLGAAAGVAAAHALLRVFLALIPFNLPASAGIAVNAAALAFSIAAALAMAVVVTLVPFLGSRRIDFGIVLRSEGRQASVGAVRVRTRHLFIVGEVALASTLLVAAGLLIQSLHRTTQQQLGFVPDRLLTFETPFTPERQKNPDARLAFTRQLLERLKATPGVAGVAVANRLPLTSQSNLPTERDGHPEHSIGGMEVRAVTDDYFSVMGIPLVRGRGISSQDVAAGAAVAVISARVADIWWPDRNAIGDRLTIGRFRGKVLLDDVSREVIGVAGDTKWVGLQAPPHPTVYVPVSSRFGSAATTWIVKTDGSGDIAASVRAAVAQVDPAQRVQRLRPMTDIVASAAATPRFNASLFSVFAGVALALTIVGLYGVLSCVVAQRTPEIGTRMALGASRGDILLAVVREGLTLTVVGLAFGLVAALGATRWLSTLLFGVAATDPISFGGVAVLVVAVGCAASYIPARRATAIDPLAAIRSE